MPEMVEVPKKEYKKLKKIEREVKMKDVLDKRKEGIDELLDPEDIEADDSDVEVGV